MSSIFSSETVTATLIGEDSPPKPALSASYVPGLKVEVTAAEDAGAEPALEAGAALPEEADACISFLHAQIAVLKPKAILAAGSTAVKNLLRTTNGVIKLHGQILDYKGIPLMTTYHPSALLHNPANKRTAWEDLKIFRAMLRQIDSDYAALTESQIQK